MVLISGVAFFVVLFCFLPPKFFCLSLIDEESIICSGVEYIPYCFIIKFEAYNLVLLHGIFHFNLLM